MARRKKNPLGDFEDALNSLGFGGSEGSESVTDIDTIDSYISTPDDDIENLDNPDDVNKPAEDNNQETETKDSAAHDDDTEIPESVLNNNPVVENTEEDTNVVSDEDDADNIDDAPSPGEAAQIGAFFDAFAEANGWSVADDEKPQSVEDLVDYIKDVVEENSTPQYADERIAQLDQYVKRGGRFEDFYQTQQRAISYDNLDMEDESTQKQVVRNYYKLQGMSDEQINRRIERYEDADMLEDEATDAVGYLKAYEQRQQEYLAQQQEAQRVEQERQSVQFMNDLNEGIANFSNIRGIAIPKEDRKALFDYITKTDADGLTQYQKDFQGNLVNNLLESAYFTMKGDALLGEANRNGQTSAANKLRNMLRHQTKNHSSYNVSREKSPQAWEIASRYL